MTHLIKTAVENKKNFVKFYKSFSNSDITNARIALGRHKNSTAKTNLLLDLYTILLCFKDPTGKAYPTQQTLARELGCTRKHVIFLLHRLETLGLLTVTRAKHTDANLRWKNKVNEYRFNSIRLAEYCVELLPQKKVTQSSLKRENNFQLDRTERKGRLRKEKKEKDKKERKESLMITITSCYFGAVEQKRKEKNDINSDTEESMAHRFQQLAEYYLDPKGSKEGEKAPEMFTINHMTYAPMPHILKDVRYNFAFDDELIALEIEGWIDHYHTKFGWNEYKQQADWDDLFYGWCKTTYQRMQKAPPGTPYVPAALRTSSRKNAYYRRALRARLKPQENLAVNLLQTGLNDGWLKDIGKNRDIRAEGVRATHVEKDIQRQYDPYMKAIEAKLKESDTKRRHNIDYLFDELEEAKIDHMAENDELLLNHGIDIYSVEYQMSKMDQVSYQRPEYKQLEHKPIEQFVMDEKPLEETWREYEPAEEHIAELVKEGVNKEFLRFLL